MKSLQGACSGDIEIEVRGRAIEKAQILQDYILLESLESKDDERNQQYLKAQKQKISNQMMDINKVMNARSETKKFCPLQLLDKIDVQNNIK